MRCFTNVLIKTLPPDVFDDVLLNIVLMHINVVFDNDFKKIKTAVYLLNLIHKACIFVY